MTNRLLARAGAALLATFILASAAPASAQTIEEILRSTENESLCLGFEEAIALSARRDPAVAASLAQRDEALAEVREARALYRPQLSAFGRTGVGDVGLVDGVIQNQIGLRLSQRILDFGDAKYARREARSRYDAVGQDTRQARIDAARNTANAYIDYLDASARIEATRERRAYFARQLDAVEKLLASGGATRVERADVAAQLADAEAFAIALEDRRRQAITQLELDTGVDLGVCANPQVDATLSAYAAPLTDAGVSVARAIAGSPILAALIRRADSLKAAQERERRQRLPVIDVVAIGAYSSTGVNGDFDFQDRVGVDVSVPLYSGARLAARNEGARARAALARSRYAEARRQLEEDVRLVFSRIISLEAQLIRRETVLAQNKELFAAAEIERRAGRRTLPDLVETRLDLEQANLDAVSMRYALLRERVSLLALTALLPVGDETDAR